MTRAPETTPEEAHIPQALGIFLQEPEKPMKYSWWARFWDRRAGRADRTKPPTNTGDVPVADTPWLRRLRGECGTMIAKERVRTEALVAVIDRELQELRARHYRAEVVIEQASNAEGRRVSELEITDDVVGAGEHYSSPEERIQRRRRERTQAMDRLRRRREAAEAELLELAPRIEVLTQERTSHWVLLQERCRRLVEHHQRRAGTYVRAMERRRDGVVWRVPELDILGWAAAQPGTGGLPVTH